MRAPRQTSVITNVRAAKNASWNIVLLRVVEGFRKGSHPAGAFLPAPWPFLRAQLLRTNWTAIRHAWEGIREVPHPTIPSLPRCLKRGPDIEGSMVFSSRRHSTCWRHAAPLIKRQVCGFAESRSTQAIDRYAHRRGPRVRHKPLSQRQRRTPMQ